MPPPGDCPDSENIASFLDGTTFGSLQSCLERHFVDCEDCFDVLCEGTTILLRLDSRSRPDGTSA
jgi:hypothetical protein